MLVGKAFIRFGIIILALEGSGVCFLNIPRIQAASSVNVALVTQTPTPSSTRTGGRTSSGVTPTSIPIPGLPRDPQRTSTITSISVSGASDIPNTPPQTYRVQPGDNIYLIAQKVYGDNTKFSLILKANNLNENSRLNVNMILKIPPLPTLTATRTSSPTLTVGKTSPPTTPVGVAASSQTVTPGEIPVPVPGVSSAGGEQSAIIAMLTYFATATLVGSSVVCAFLAFLVFTSARRDASQHAMARRVRPPLVR